MDGYEHIINVGTVCASRDGCSCFLVLYVLGEWKLAIHAIKPSIGGIQRSKVSVV